MKPTVSLESHQRPLLKYITLAFVVFAGIVLLVPGALDIKYMRIWLLAPAGILFAVVSLWYFFRDIMKLSRINLFDLAFALLGISICASAFTKLA